MMPMMRICQTSWRKNVTDSRTSPKFRLHGITNHVSWQSQKYKASSAWDHKPCVDMPKPKNTQASALISPRSRRKQNIAKLLSARLLRLASIHGKCANLDGTVAEHLISLFVPCQQLCRNKKPNRFREQRRLSMNDNAYWLPKLQMRVNSGLDWRITLNFYADSRKLVWTNFVRGSTFFLIQTLAVGSCSME